MAGAAWPRVSKHADYYITGAAHAHQFNYLLRLAYIHSKNVPLTITNYNPAPRFCGQEKITKLSQIIINLSHLLY